MSNFNLKKYLAENKLVKEQNITITHNDASGDSKSTVVDVSLIDNLINSLQPIVGNKTIEIDNEMREDFIQTIVRRLTGYTDMGGGNVRINEESSLNESKTLQLTPEEHSRLKYTLEQKLNDWKDNPGFWSEHIVAVESILNKLR